jgi:hypothetical protein
MSRLPVQGRANVKQFLLCTLMGLALGCLSGAATAATQARVATGAKVSVVPSARTVAQWSAKRPQFRELRPKVRGTFD